MIALALVALDPTLAAHHLGVVDGGPQGERQLAVLHFPLGGLVGATLSAAVVLVCLLKTFIPTNFEIWSQALK